MEQKEINSSAAIDITGRRLALNTLLNVIGQVAPLLVAMVTVPYVVRHLGPDRFGLLSLAWMVVGYFALFDLGIGPATTKFVAELLARGEIERLPEAVWTALITQTSFGVVSGVLLALASPLLMNHLLKIPYEIRPEAHLIFLMLSAVLPVDFATGSLRGVLAASQRFDLLNALSIPLSALNYLLPVGAIAAGYGLPTIVLFLILSRGLSLVVLAVLCLRVYPSLALEVRFERRLVRSFLGFGGWVTLSGAVAPILVYFDRFLIGSVISIAAVGYYTPPYMISDKLAILPASMATTLFPAFSASAALGDLDWIRNTLIRSLKFLLMTVGPMVLAVALFAHSILTFWLGARFAAEGTRVLQILSIGVFFNSLAFVPGNLLYGVGRPDLNAKIHLFELPLHIGVAWLLVTRFGLPGAALAWAIRVTLDFVLLIVATCWMTRTSLRLLVCKDLRRVVGALVALAACLVGLWASTQVLLVEVVFSLLLSGGFLLVSWRFVLNMEEKWHIRLWLKLAR